MQNADDATLCFSGKSKSFLESQATEDLNNLVKLFNYKNLTTNTSKSNFISFSLRPVDTESGPAVMFG